MVGELKYRATLNLFIKVEINRQRLHISFPCSVLLNFQVCGLCFYLYMCVYICMHSCICICPMTAHCFPPRCWCGACVARRPPPSSFRFISRRVPHFLIITAPMWTVLTQNWFTQHFPPAKNWLRTVFIFSPLKRFDRRQKLGEERIGT